MIGGDYCNTDVPADLLPGDIQKLTANEMDVLWRLFQEIGRTWKCSRADSHNIRSDWLEFIHAKTNVPPSYVGEYSNAVSCVSELIVMYGEKEAFRKLLLDHGMRDPKAPPLTRVAHAKVYVVNEFIRVQVAKDGFKSWQGSNYKGYVGGSRFNRKPRARIGVIPAPVPGKVPPGEVGGA
jgi:hypothetical protein